MSISPEQLKSIRLILRIVAPITILTNLAVIYCVISKKQLQNNFMNLLQAFLAACEIGVSIVRIVGTEIAVTNPIACQVLGAAVQFWTVGVSSWSVLIAVYCYLTVVRDRKSDNQLLELYYLYGWGLPLILTVSLFGFQALLQDGNVFGDAVFECWISSSYANLRVYLFYIPLWIHFFIMLILYGLVWAHIQVAAERLSESVSSADRTPQISVVVPGNKQKRLGNEFNLRISERRSTLGHISAQKDLQASNQKLIIKCTLLTVGFFITWGPPTATRLIGDSAPGWLFVWSAAAFASAGFWNSGIFLIILYWADFTGARSSTSER